MLRELRLRGVEEGAPRHAFWRRAHCSDELELPSTACMVLIDKLPENGRYIDLLVFLNQCHDIGPATAVACPESIKKEEANISILVFVGDNGLAFQI